MPYIQVNMADYNLAKHFRVTCPRCEWVQHPRTCYLLNNPRCETLTCDRHGCNCTWKTADVPRPDPSESEEPRRPLFADCGPLTMPNSVPTK